ncbi:phosphoribosylformylglycinamidine cyclo-ligase [Streptococcus pyogenes ABC020046158]|nr:AIR synthase-related protein [Streptococcus pyogenes]EZM35386.1 phosphoribosylformylglycinamidine cyclo-ligase [Streptococcus pyogenes ABC020046158]
MSEKNAYAKSGVDVEAGYEVVERIKKHVARTERAGVMGALGGFIENVPRMFADDLAAEIDEDKVPVLPIFKALEKYGDIKHEEMFEIFNMGVGLMLAVSPENVNRVKELLDEPVYEIGRIIKKADDSVVIK